LIKDLYFHKNSDGKEEELALGFCSQIKMLVLQRLPNKLAIKCMNEKERAVMKARDALLEETCVTTVVKTIRGAKYSLKQNLDEQAARKTPISIEKRDKSM